MNLRRALTLPPDARQRAYRLAAVLVIHLVAALAFLTLAPKLTRQKFAEMAAISLSIPTEEPAPEPEPAQEPSDPEPVEAAPVEAPPVEIAPAPPAPPIPVPPPPPEESTAIAPPPPAPPAPAKPRRVYGPPDIRPPRQPDSELVDGTGPNGEPLYAASWYREPYDDELRGFLSVTRGPGWGMIACRTVPDYRVQDCVIVGESPVGSGIAQAVQAAAWQFRVRPPRIGGKDQVGEWVRIRIDYDLRSRPPAYRR